ncbi:hypothetical protein BHM03_00032184 [Ensete ventricosum]|uniref:Secreted protein n=1 Tax=Ensete ventricosum TaxID=4639 RepID=A0A427A9B7_ENSVE|nr:hypothetical protein B296_00016175 [Ensete ventricosum]RZS02188.1 hypothetical protein BHM03_00032184 [Ensete ventricosum]
MRPFSLCLIFYSVIFWFILCLNQSTTKTLIPGVEMAETPRTYLWAMSSAPANTQPFPPPIFKAAASQRLLHPRGFDLMGAALSMDRGTATAKAGLHGYL